MWSRWPCDLLDNIHSRPQHFSADVQARAQKIRYVLFNIVWYPWPCDLPNYVQSRPRRFSADAKARAKNLDIVYSSVMCSFWPCELLDNVQSKKQRFSAVAKATAEHLNNFNLKHCDIADHVISLTTQTLGPNIFGWCQGQGRKFRYLFFNIVW